MATTIKTNTTTPTLSSGWMGILTGIRAQQPITWSLADRTDDGFYTQTPIILHVDETSATTARDPSGTLYPSSISYSYNTRPSTRDTVVVQEVVATFGRLIVPLTSRGVEVTLVPIDTPGAGNLAVVEGRALSGDDNRLVFTLTLKSDGTYTYQSHAGIDHPKANEANEALNLFFTYQLNGKPTDALMVRVHDDVPVEHRADFTVALAEGDYTHPNLPASTVELGDVPLDFGVDGPAAAQNAPVTVLSFAAEVNGAAHPLRSHGDLVTFKPVPNQPGSVEGWAGDRLVFRFEIDSYGQDRLTLFQPLDHPDAQDHHDSLKIVFDLLIKDYDGDVSKARTSVEILDDGPTMTTPVSSGDETRNGATVDGQFTYDFGRDGPSVEQEGVVNLALDPGRLSLSADGVPLELSSRGVAVDTFEVTALSDGSSFLQAYAGATKVFEITLHQSGEYTFKQYEPLDHPQHGDDGAGEHNDNIELFVGVDLNGFDHATDYDRDQVIGGFSLILADDGPTGAAAVNLVNADADDDVHEQDGVGVHRVMVGHYEHDFGFDRAAVVSDDDNGLGGFEVLAARVHYNNAAQELTSDGQSITFQRDTQDGHVLWGRVGDRDILKLTLDTDHQTISYEQIGGIDHPDSTVPDEVVDLSFDLRLTDADGDTLDTTVTVNDIHDGAPVAMHDTDKTVRGASTSGNLITGEDPDQNQDVAGSSYEFRGDLARDGQGSDALLLRSITHAGVVYTLSEDRQSVTASDGTGEHQFDADTGVLTLNSGLGGQLLLDMVGEDVGTYHYTAPEALDLTASLLINGSNFNALPEGIRLMGYAGSGSVVQGGGALSVGDDGAIGQLETLALNLGGRLASSIDVTLADGTVMTMPAHQLYRFGSTVDSIVTGSGPYHVVAASSTATDAYQVGDLAFAIEDQNLGAGDYLRSYGFEQDWNAGVSFGEIYGETYTIGGYRINMPWPVPDIWIPEVTIDTRTGLKVDLNTTGHFGMNVQFKFDDYSYDLDTTLDTSLLAPTDPTSSSYYDFDPNTLVASQDLTLNPAAWEVKVGLDFLVNLSGSYEARIPFLGASGTFNENLIDLDMDEFLTIGMNNQGMVSVKMFGYSIVGPGFGRANDASGVTLPSTNIASIDGSGHTIIERMEFDLPALFRSVAPGDLGVIPDLASITLYNFTDIMQGVASTVQNNHIQASAESLVLGVMGDLDALLASILFGNPAAFGGSVKAGNLELEYDLFDLDMGPVFGIQQDVDIAPKLMANLAFSAPVYVEGLTDPVRSLNDVDWQNLPGIKPVGDQPVTVTPSFYYASNVSNDAYAKMNLGLEFDVAELDLKYKLAPGVSPSLAGVGPLFSYDNIINGYQLGRLWGDDNLLVDEEQLYDNLGNFVFPLAPNPFPNGGLDAVTFQSGADPYAIQQIQVNFDPAGYGKEFFSYVLEDADGDQSSANFVVSISDELPQPDDIRLSRAAISESARNGAVIGQLSAYAMGASLAEVYGNAGAFELLDDAGGRFAVDGIGRLMLSSPLDYESHRSHSITVRVTNSDGAAYQEQLTIDVLDANEVPILAAASLEVDERETGVVGTITAHDPEAGSIQYSLLSGDDRFSIDATSGALSLNEGVLYDPQHPSFTLTVRAQDAGGLSSTAQVTVNVNDINLAPESISLYDHFVFRDLLLGDQPHRVVGALTGTDPDVGDVLTWSVLTHADLFEVVDGVLQVRAGVQLLGDSYDVTVRASDRVPTSAGLYRDQTFRVDVLASNAHAPTGVLATPEDLRVQENGPAGALVATLQLDDADGERGQFAFASVGGVQQDGEGRFVLVGDELRLAEGVSLNFEEAAAYGLSVVGTDAAGHAVTSTLTVTVQDINEAPLAVPDRVITVLASGQLVLPYFALSHNDHDDDADLLSFSAGLGTPAGWTFNNSAQQLEINLSEGWTSEPLNGLYQVSDGAATVFSMLAVSAPTGAQLVGDEGSEILLGGAGAETLNGGAGQDVLIGGGGADVLLGGADDDLLVVSDLAWAGLNGGTGQDTLHLTRGINLDLRAAVSANDSVLARVDSVEAVDLVNGLVNHLYLDMNGVLALSDRTQVDGANTNTVLLVRGDASDIVHLSGSGWTLQTQTVAGTTTPVEAVLEGTDYAIWRNDGSSADLVGVLVLVETGLSVL